MSTLQESCKMKQVKRSAFLEGKKAHTHITPTPPTANLFESSDISLIQVKSSGFSCLVLELPGCSKSLKYVAARRAQGNYLTFLQRFTKLEGVNLKILTM